MSTRPPSPPGIVPTPGTSADSARDPGRRAPSLSAPRVRGPVRPGERALAPDLARGAMLLLIALANAAGYFLASAPGIATEPRGVERLANFLLIEFVHARAFPLFAIMFGYGLVQLARRQEAAGAAPREVRRILTRRNAWLVVLGAAHGILLYSGDFLGAYGLLGIAFTMLFLQRGDRFHRFAPWYLAIAGAYVLVLAAMVATGLGSASGAPAPVSVTPFPSAEAATYIESLTLRLAEWPVHTAILLSLVFLVWLGAWAARRRILEAPGRHLRLLGWTAGLGFAIAFAGGMPMALLSADVLEADAATVPWIRSLYETSGGFGGVAYVALFGLLAHALRRRGGPGPVATAVSALGQRSLSGYLFQSVAWTVLAAPFGLALGRHVGSPLLTALVCAAVVWLVSVVLAEAMRRRDKRGPAEVLLRRLTYGRR